MASDPALFATDMRPRIYDKSLRIYPALFIYACKVVAWGCSAVFAKTSLKMAFSSYLKTSILKIFLQAQPLSAPIVDSGY